MSEADLKAAYRAPPLANMEEEAEPRETDWVMHQPSLDQSICLAAIFGGLGGFFSRSEGIQKKCNK